jgi:long-chain fatty acid transport protein
MKQAGRIPARIATGAGLVMALGVMPAAYAVNGFQMIGFGEYQIGTGGAVTASPASAMTALTNPAGLTRVGERADFSMEAFMPSVHIDTTRSAFSGGGASPGEKVQSSGDFYGIPSIGWVARTSVDGLYFGGGMYATAGLGADFGSVDMNSGGISFNGYSNVGIFRISPAVGYQLSPAVSIGLAMNVNMLQLGFRETLSNAGPYDFNFDLGRAGQSFGLGATVGVLVDVIPQRLRLGASYTTRNNFRDTPFRLAAGDIDNSNNLLDGPTGVAPKGTYDAAFDFPQQAAIGVAYTPGARLTLSADVKWIAYSDTLANFYVSGPTGVYNLKPGWRDVMVYAVGVAYQATPTFRLLAGYNYSDSPVQADHVFANLVFPAIVRQHYTLGAHKELGKNWNLGGAILYSPRESLTGSGDFNGADSGITLDNRIVSVGMNVGYKF